MGDGLLIRSIVENLRERHPQIEIGLLVGPGTSEVMTVDAPYRVHRYCPEQLGLRSALRVLANIRQCHYEAILNFEQRSLAGSAFLAFAGVACRIGFIPIIDTPKGWFLTHTVRFEEKDSVWQSFLRLTKMIDVGFPETLLPRPFRWSTEIDQWADHWWFEHLGAFQTPVLALHVGSKDRVFSRWPLERYVELAERLRRTNQQLKVMLTGTAPERMLINDFIRMYSGTAVDASETGSLARTGALLSRCRLLVSNDTGVMHLGAALGVPTVGLFGPNSPRYWAPLGPRATYVYETKIPCSPCLNLYSDRWPSDCFHHEKRRCMLDIGVQAVVEAAMRIGAGKVLNCPEVNSCCL